MSKPLQGRPKNHTGLGEKKTSKVTPALCAEPEPLLQPIGASHVQFARQHKAATAEKIPYPHRLNVSLDKTPRWTVASFWGLLRPNRP